MGGECRVARWGHSPSEACFQGPGVQPAGVLERNDDPDSRAWIWGPHLRGGRSDSLRGGIRESWVQLVLTVTVIHFYNSKDVKVNVKFSHLHVGRKTSFTDGK